MATGLERVSTGRSDPHSVTPVSTRQFDEGVLTPICSLLHFRAHISVLTASGFQVDSFLRSSNGRMYPAPDRRRWWLFGPLSAMRRLTFLCNRDSVIPLPLNRQRRSCGQFLKQAGEPFQCLFLELEELSSTPLRPDKGWESTSRAIPPPRSASQLSSAFRNTSCSSRLTFKHSGRNSKIGVMYG